MLSLERQSRLRYTHPYSVFLLRRLFRIFPLSILFVVVVCSFRLPLGHLESRAFLPAQFTPITVFSNFLLIQNLTASESVLDPLWSLPYEVQMCLVLPLLFGLAIASEGITALLLLWAAACLGSIALGAAGLPTALLRYTPCFLAGVVGYRVAIRSARQWPTPVWPLMLLAITVAYLLFPVDAVGWVCCLGVGLLIPQVRELGEGYLRESCRLVARYSYGVYVSHAVLIWLAFDELATWPLVARWSLFAVTTVVVPVALYHAIEAPLIALGRRLVRRRFQRRPLAMARGRMSLRAELLRARCESKVLFGSRVP